MPVDRRKVAVFGGAFVLRLLLLLLFPSLPDLLTGRVEVSTPVNSFKRREFYTKMFSVCLKLLRLTSLSPVQEGLFLYTHNVSPYDGGVFHQV
jgi:phosphatidylinositol glycan class U